MTCVRRHIQMSEKRYKHVKKLLQKIGPGFCAAKWYNATIWLSNGRTASCHHPEAHNVPLDELKQDPRALHNTKFKLQQRLAMLQGDRPDECGYCWRIEDADNIQYSDRIFKSEIYTDKQIKQISNFPWDKPIDPKTLEISFDNLCNLSCSYCNAEFSTTWNNDIRVNGNYKNLKTKEGKTYDHPFEFNEKIIKIENIYVQKFFEWFDKSLRKNLEELRITGGEPTMSPHFWKFVSKYHNEKFKFSVNSNMQMTKKRLDKLVDCSQQFKHFELYTSNESHGKVAEMIRYGLNYNTWINNLKYFSKYAKYHKIHIMMTINALCLFGIESFLDDIMRLKQSVNNTDQFILSINILRFPSFQSVNILPQVIKQERADVIQRWVDANNNNMISFETANLHRLISYLNNVDRSYEDTDSWEDKYSDFKNFYNQYCKRRNIDFIDIFSIHPDFIKWWEDLPETNS